MHRRGTKEDRRGEEGKDFVGGGWEMVIRKGEVVGLKTGRGRDVRSWDT